MSKIKKISLFESDQDISKHQQELLDLMMKSKESWRNFYLELKNNKKEKFLEHFQIENFANKKTGEMLSLLYSLENDEFLNTWVKERIDKLPVEFLEIFGVNQDLKKLGF